MVGICARFSRNAAPLGCFFCAQKDPVTPKVNKLSSVKNQVSTKMYDHIDAHASVLSKGDPQALASGRNSRFQACFCTGAAARWVCELHA